MIRPMGWLVVAFSFFSLASVQAESKTAIQPGTAAPAWKNLPGIDGEYHSLDQLKDAKVVVVAFTCNSCPFAEAYEDRFVQFTNEYKSKGVAFVAINVNLEDEDRLPAMKLRAKEKEFSFPYLYDESQQLGVAYGAKVTPHLFVLDKDRKVAYVGAFDNAKTAAKVTKHYVTDAVDALLAGSKPAVESTRATGCSIRYDD